MLWVATVLPCSNVLAVRFHFIQIQIATISLAKYSMVFFTDIFSHQGVLELTNKCHLPESLVLFYLLQYCPCVGAAFGAVVKPGNGE